MADRLIPRPECHILACPHQFHHREGEVGETVGVGLLLPYEEPGERFRIWLFRQDLVTLCRLPDDPLPVLRCADDAVDHGAAGGGEERRQGSVRRDHELLDETPGEVLFLDGEPDDPVALDDRFGLDRLKDERPLLCPAPLHPRRCFMLEEDLFLDSRGLPDRLRDRAGPLQPVADLLVDEFRVVPDKRPVDTSRYDTSVREDGIPDDDRHAVLAGQE